MARNGVILLPNNNELTRVGEKCMRGFRCVNLALRPFALCVAFLMLLGKLCGLTYKQISVVFNLWLQGVVLVLSAILPLVMSVIRICDGFTFPRLLLVIFLVFYDLVYIWAFLRMLHHYHLPVNRAFDRYVHDLQVLARKWHTSYQVVNLLIFVIAFLFLFSLNFCISYFIYLWI